MKGRFCKMDENNPKKMENDTPKRRRKRTYRPRMIVQSNLIHVNIPNFRSEWKARIFQVALQKVSQDKGHHLQLTVPLSHFKKVLHVPSGQKGHLQTTVEEMVTDFGRDLMTVSVEIPKKGQKTPDMYSFFSYFKYDKGTETVIIGVSPYVQPYYKGIASTFKAYPLQEAVWLTQYAQQVYLELIAKVNSTKLIKGKKFYRVKWFDFLNTVLKVPKSYENNNHYIFKRIMPTIYRELSPLFLDFDIDYGMRKATRFSNIDTPAFVTFSFSSYQRTDEKELVALDYGTLQENLNANKRKLKIVHFDPNNI